MPHPIDAIIFPSIVMLAPVTRCTRAIMRSLPRSRDDVWNQARAKALDLIFKEKLALFQALQLQAVLRRVAAEAPDHVVEIVVLDLKRLKALADFRLFLFRKREVCHL